MKIKKINKIDYDGDVYNLRIKEEDSSDINNHNYFANELCVSNCHIAKSPTLIKILERTFGTSKLRFGMSGTYPTEGTAELFTIESLMGPKLLNIKAKKLMDDGIISNVKIKGIILNHNDRSFAENVFAVKK